MLGVDGYLSGNTEGGVLLARTRGAELRLVLAMAYPGAQSVQRKSE